jgi:CRP/FNR family transcriptional regulator, cyclic AMP receptor protein
MSNEDKLNTLRQFPFFMNLDADVLESIVASVQYKTIPRHHYIFVPGDHSQEVFFLVEGRVKLGSYSEDFKESVREILHPLAYFGELSLTGEEKRDGFAMSLQEGCKILVLNAEVMLMHMLQNLQVQMLIMKAFGRRVRNAEHRVVDLIYKDARTRIIEYLKEAVTERGKKVGTEFFLKHGLTQQDIASITGTSRQTVTLVLNELRKHNCIHFTRQRLLIRDLDKLSSFSHAPK